MPDADAGIERRAVSLNEVKSGLKLRAGHPVVLIVADIQGRRRIRAEQPARPAARAVPTDRPGEQGEPPGGKRNIRGTFRVGDHVLKAATFRLRKDNSSGPLVTPDSLAGGKTDLRWVGDHWVTGDDGKYRFTGLADGKYFVELFSQDPAAEGGP